jgi:SOS response regulatory protein OraA/RecX
VVAYLTEQAIISDYRYAQLWLRARLSRKVESPRQLMAALCSRSIDRDTAQEALAEVLEPDTEWALLTRYVAKTPPPPDGFSIRQTLKYQGFSPLVIDRACCHLPWRCIED